MDVAQECVSPLAWMVGGARHGVLGVFALAAFVALRSEDHEDDE